MPGAKLARDLARKTTRAVVPKTATGRFHNLLFALSLLPLFVLTWFAPRHALVAAHQAAAQGDLGRLQRLAEQDPKSLLREDVGGASALHYAALNHELPAARYLLARGLDPNCRNLQGQSPLFYAVTANDERMVDFLIARGADPDLVDKHGLTPLYLAVVRGFPAMVEQLARYGVNPEVEHVSGRRPLHEAALRNSPGMVKTLLAMGADAEALDKNGETALMLARRHRLRSVEQVLRDRPPVGAGTVRSKRN